jgi:hypothetical protein
MTAQSAALLNLMAYAAAVGDRVRLIELARRLAELLRSADGSRLRKLLELINSENVQKIGALVKELLALFGISLDFSVASDAVPLSLDEQYACIDEAFAGESSASDLAGIIAIIKLVMQLIAAIRGALPAPPATA